MYPKNAKTLYILTIVCCLSPLTLDAAQVNPQKDTSIQIPIIDIGGKKAFAWIKTIKIDTMENPFKEDKDITITPEQIIQVKTVLSKIEIMSNELPKSMLKKIKCCPNPDDNDSNEHKANPSQNTQLYKLYDVLSFICNNYNSYEEAQKEWKENQLKVLITGINAYFNLNLWFKSQVKDYNFRYAHEQMLGKCKACLPLPETSDDDDQLSIEVDKLIKNNETIDNNNSAVEIFVD